STRATASRAREVDCAGAGRSSGEAGNPPSGVITVGSSSVLCGTSISHSPVSYAPAQPPPLPAVIPVDGGASTLGRGGGTAGGHSCVATKRCVALGDLLPGTTLRLVLVQRTSMRPPWSKATTYLYLPFVALTSSAPGNKPRLSPSLTPAALACAS